MLFFTFSNKYKSTLNLLKRKVSLFCVSEEVRQALLEKKPVLALESTIITHGMKFPNNLKTAKEVEIVVRNQDVVPATVAVIKGKVKVGLSIEELEDLAKNQDTLLKISRRDFPYAISQKFSGGTTVSGTMIVAHKTGIPVFSTGGIGGVHRGGEITMDISADLNELGKTPVAVVSSGVKSILDIEKTLEYLETQGVAVATFGLTKSFPAFYSAKSGYSSPCNLTSFADTAEFIQVIFDMNLNSGVLIAVPVPEGNSLNVESLEKAIRKGLEAAKEKNIKGKNITPFLLNQVSQITEGKSLESNIALIKNNAFVGAKIAAELAKLRQSREKSSGELIFDIGGVVKSRSEKVKELERKKKEKFDVVVIGGTNLDVVVNLSDNILKEAQKGPPNWNELAKSELDCSGRSSESEPELQTDRHGVVSFGILTEKLLIVSKLMHQKYVQFTNCPLTGEPCPRKGLSSEASEFEFMPSDARPNQNTIV